MSSTAVVRGELDLNSRKFEAGISRAQQQIKSLESTARRLGTLSFFAGGAAIVSTTRTIIDFQREMSKTGALVNANSQEFDELTDKARELGSSTLFSAKEAAAGFAFLAQAGFETNEILESSKDFLNLAAAASLDLATTMDIASNIMQGFGLAAESSGRAVDVLSNIAASSNTNVLDLGEAMKQIGPVAAAGSVDIESAAAAVGLLANAGIKGSLSGTGLRNIILRLSDPTSEAKKAIAALGLTIGELNPATNSLVDIFGRIKSGMDGASDSAMALGAASDIFGLRAAASGLVLSSNVEELDNLTQSNRESAGTTEMLAGKIQDNLGGALKILQSRLDELKLTISDGGFGEAMRKAVDDASDALEIFIASGSAEELGQNLAQFLKVSVAAFENLVSVIRSAASTFQENKELFSGMAKAALGLYAGIKAIQLAAFIADLGKTAVGLATSTAGFFSNTAAITANTAAHRANSVASGMSMAQATRQMDRLEFLGTKTQKSYKKSGKAAANFWKLATPSRLLGGGAIGLFVGALAFTAGEIQREADKIKALEDEMDRVSESSRDIQGNLKASRTSNDEDSQKLAYLELLQDEKRLKESIRNGDETSTEGRRLQEVQLKAVSAELDRQDKLAHEKALNDGRSKRALEEQAEAQKKIHALQDSVPIARIHDIQSDITKETLRQRKALEDSPSLNQEKQIAALEKTKAALDQLKDSRKRLDAVTLDLGLGSSAPRELENFLRETQAKSGRGDLLGFASSIPYAKKLSEITKQIEKNNPEWSFGRAQKEAKRVLTLAREIHDIGTSSQLVGRDDVMRASRISDIMKSMGGSGDESSRRSLAEDLLKIEEKRSKLSEEDAATQLEKEESARRAAKDEMKLLRAQAGLGGNAEAIKLSQEEAKLALQIKETQNIGAQQAYAQAKEKLKLEKEVTKQKEAQKEADNIAKKTAEIAERAINQQVSDVNSLIDRLDRRADSLPGEIRDNNGNRDIKGRARNDVRREQQVEVDKLQGQAKLASSKLKELKKSTSGTNLEIQATERELKNLQSAIQRASGAAGKSKTGGTAVQGNRASLTGRSVGGGKLVGGEGKKTQQRRQDLLKAQKQAFLESRKEAAAQAAAEKAALEEERKRQAELNIRENQLIDEKSNKEDPNKKGEKSVKEQGAGVGLSVTGSFTEAASDITDAISGMKEAIVKAITAVDSGSIAQNIDKIREYYDELDVV
jgi:TP901 family phage tail tape measure protein